MQQRNFLLHLGEKGVEGLQEGRCGGEPSLVEAAPEHIPLEGVIDKAVKAFEELGEDGVLLGAEPFA